MLEFPDMAKPYNRLLALALALAGGAFAQPQIGGGTCSLSSLAGNYWFSFAGRLVSSAGTFQGVQQQVDFINFDGKGNFTGTVFQNSSQATGQSVSTGGTLTIASDCTGTVSVGGGTHSLVVYNGGTTFNVSGIDKKGIVGSGTGAVLPSACVTSLLSGPYAFSANGYVISASSVTGVANVNGLLQFDGMGAVTAKWDTFTPAITAVSATGNYSVNTPSPCLGTVTLADSGGNAYSLVFAITNPKGGDFQFIASGPQLIFAGSAHATFQNPSQSITNGASFISGEAPPGSIFTIFGENLGPNPGAYGSTLPLPTDVGATRVAVNGKDVPIFYAGSGQINAQMPVNIAPGLATVVVSSGNATSNAAAVNIPAAAPGIFTYGPDNHAVVINAHGHLNAETVPAHVGDEVVVYFTGGGPVNPSGLWTTGAAAPFGKSPLSDANSVTVNGKPATVVYTGLTGGSVGLYQANFVIPQVSAGDQSLVITVNGVNSKAAIISIAE